MKIMRIIDKIVSQNSIILMIMAIAFAISHLITGNEQTYMYGLLLFVGSLICDTLERGFSEGSWPKKAAKKEAKGQA